MISTEFLQTSKKTQRQISSILDKHFKVHPFYTGLSQENLETVMTNYLAMSQAFPDWQAGSQKEQIFYYIETNGDVSEQTEITTVVGNFLAWDETGGHSTLQKMEFLGYLRFWTRNITSIQTC